MRKTTSLAGFSVGNKDMGPVLVGVVMASSIASTATFVINPGFVYTHGLSALLHYGVAAQAGVALGLVLVCKGFRRVGEEHACLTIPDWIRARFGSPALALFFALINLLSIAFVVLIMVGCAILVVQLLGLSYVASLIAVLLVVFSYVLMGGTYAHAYTNAVQGVLMAGVALLLFFSGLGELEGGLMPALRQVSADYAAIVNPSSDLYGDVFSVFVSAFVVTFALMMQPHILTKVLYLRSDRDVNRFLITSIGMGLVYGLCLFAGLWARLRGLDVPPEAQDTVVARYVGEVFGTGIGGNVLATVVLVALLAAGMSTLDGILVALSAMVTHDLYLRLRPQDAAGGLRLSRYVLVGVGLVAFVLALDPPQLVGLFAQKGVYGIAAASFVPIVLGVLVPGPVPARLVGLAAGTGLVLHLVLHLVVGIENPAVSACWAIIASSVLAAIAMLLRPR
ncbi:MAG: sodium:solute symporter family protein [Myxococcales bacterium]|nr:sodium:solute symporter family protein [Myxococcales bacterium]